MLAFALKAMKTLFIPMLCAAAAIVVSAETAAPKADPRIEALVAAVSQERIKTLVETLAGFHTRNTLSDTESTTRGIGAARQWIFDELTRSNPRLEVSFDTYKLGRSGRITRSVELRNLLAILPGRSLRRIYVSAHYDTVSIPKGQIEANTRPPTKPGEKPPPDPQLRRDQDYNVDAPGANDNGSGTALTMELARVIAASGLEFDATIVFALWAGEEQGLVGARAHASRLVKDKVVVDADFNNDIVGNTHGGGGQVDAGSVRVYSEGPEDSMSRSLARFIERMATVYVPSHKVRLLARQDRFSRGSDNAAFNQYGFPAVVFRESTENFAKQHSALDTVDGVDPAYLTQNARVNLAALAALALAPAAPKVTNERNQPTIGRQPSGYDANLRWTPSPGATAYTIYWREAWTSDWQHSERVGDVKEFVMPKMSIDDFVFGVAAVGANGHESLVSAYLPAARRDAEVKTR
jgi:hypothetical protein